MNEAIITTVTVDIEELGYRSWYPKREVVIETLQRTIEAGQHTLISDSLKLWRNRVRGRFAPGWAGRVLAIPEGRSKHHLPAEMPYPGRRQFSYAMWDGSWK